MNESAAFPFPAWDGGYAQHLAVAPDGGVYRVPSGTHERLHRAVIGDRNLTDRFEGLRGTKVELALAGWTQLQSDRLTDRVNVDAPDGFDGVDLVRRFARMHDAGSVAIALYPSKAVLTGPLEELSLPAEGSRVSVSVDGE